MGCRDVIEASSAALEVLPDPYKLAAQTMLQAILSISLRYYIYIFKYKLNININIKMKNHKG